MLQGEHSAILSTFIKLLFTIKIFVLSILEWPFTQVLLYIKDNQFNTLVHYFYKKVIFVTTARVRHQHYYTTIGSYPLRSYATVI